MRALLEHKASVDAFSPPEFGSSYCVHLAYPNLAFNSKKKQTPLMLSSNIETTKLLLEYHSEVNARDTDGKTALMYTAPCEFSTPEFLQTLITAKADPEITCNKGLKAFDYAIKKRNIVAAQFLAQKMKPEKRHCKCNDCTIL